MFVSHLPAGYILTTFAQKTVGDCTKTVLITGLIASVIPDVDLLWFYLADERQTVHHAYLTHAPLFWLGIGALAWLGLKVLQVRAATLFVGIGLANVFLHLALDSIAAEIRWLWPISVYELNLVTVPAKYNWWVWNFVLHWTFLAELAIFAIAVTIWLRRHVAR